MNDLIYCKERNVVQKNFTNEKQKRTCKKYLLSMNFKVLPSNILENVMLKVE